jgi:multiple sugar transport system substrate-binding protein
MKRLVLLIAASLLLGACIPGSNAPETLLPTAAPAATPQPTATVVSDAGTPSADEVVTLGFGAVESEREYFEPLIGAFNQENPGIQVQFVALDDVMRQEANQAYDPDLTMRRTVSTVDTASYSFTYLRPEDISRGYLRDLKPLMDADASFDRDDFYPGTLERFSRGGGIYMLPRFIDVRLLSYNKELWHKKGLAPPRPDWSMQDMLAAARQLATKRGDAIEVYGTLALGEQQVLYQELLSVGIDLLAMPPEQVRLDQPDIAAALERTIELGKSGAIYLPKPPPQGQPYTDDYQGMIFDQHAAIWSPETIYWGSRGGDPPFKVGTAAYPASSLPRGSVGADGYIMSSGTRHPEAAWRWLAFLSKQPPSSNYQWQRPADAGNLPARKSVAERAGYWKNLDQEAKAAVEAMLGRPVPPLPATFDSPIIAPLSEAIQAVLRGEQKPAQALRAAQAQLVQQIAQTKLTPTPSSPAESIVVATPQIAAAPPGATTITYVTPLGFNTDMLHKLAKGFNQQHSDIFVNVKELDVNGLAAAAARSDCFSWFGPPETTEMTVTLDIQPLIDGDPSFSHDDYPDMLLAPFRQGSRLYGLPSTVNLRMLAYNQSAFDAAGQPHPTADWTLDQLIDTATKLTAGAGNNQRYGFAAAFGHTQDIRFFLQQYGAPVLKGRGDTQQPNFTHPKVAQVLRMYLGLLRSASPHKQIQGYTHSWVPDAEQLINEGRVAMWFDYGSQVNMMRSQSASAPNIAVAPPPLGLRSLTPDDFNTNGLFISATTQQPEACWAWLKAVSEDVSGLEGAFPARISIAESEAFRAQAMPGAIDVYQAYKAGFRRTPETTTEADFNRSPIDFFWFYRAADRALQGGDLDRELGTAQALTEQYLACVRAGTATSTCAKQVDPHYEGWKSAEEP